MDRLRDTGSEATRYRLAKAMEECMRAQPVDAITVTNIAERCGVTRQTVNAIENNKYDPTLSLAFRLADALGTTVDALFLRA